MTLIWCLSPLVGFFLTPILGSLSDRYYSNKRICKSRKHEEFPHVTSCQNPRNFNKKSFLLVCHIIRSSRIFFSSIIFNILCRCKSPLGRRRPFIILLSIGVVLGLLLVPNGKALGRLMGDKYYHKDVDAPTGRMPLLEDDYYHDDPANITILEVTPVTPPPDLHTYHPWGILFTIIGTVLLDFDADACQSPSRAYLLDVTLPGNEESSLSTSRLESCLFNCLLVQSNRI